jgi:hypothetical protein
MIIMKNINKKKSFLFQTFEIILYYEELDFLRNPVSEIALIERSDKTQVSLQVTSRSLLKRKNLRILF